MALELAKKMETGKKKIYLKNYLTTSLQFDFSITNILFNFKTRVGTPLYIDPEGFEGVDYGFEANVWSLGRILLVTSFH